MGVNGVPWLRSGATMWEDPATASALAELPAQTLRTLADEGLLTTLPQRDARKHRRYRRDELLALKNCLAGLPKVDLNLIRRLAGR